MTGKKKEFTALATKSKANCLYEINNRQEDGRVSYFFVLIDPVKEKAFFKAYHNNKECLLSDYGTIVASGWGEPPESVKQRMREEYGAAF